LIIKVLVSNQSGECVFKIIKKKKSLDEQPPGPIEPAMAFISIGPNAFVGLSPRPKVKRAFF
jgi:hypothetical protein